MKLPRRTFLHLVAGAAALPVSRVAWAQAYPARQITMIVPFPPGGSATSSSNSTARWCRHSPILACALVLVSLAWTSPRASSRPGRASPPSTSPRSRNGGRSLRQRILSWNDRTRHSINLVPRMRPDDRCGSGSAARADIRLGPRQPVIQARPAPGGTHTGHRGRNETPRSPGRSCSRAPPSSLTPHLGRHILARLMDRHAMVMSGDSKLRPAARARKRRMMRECGRCWFPWR